LEHPYNVAAPLEDFPEAGTQQFVNRRHAKWKEIATVCRWFAFYAWQREKRGKIQRENEEKKEGNAKETQPSARIVIEKISLEGITRAWREDPYQFSSLSPIPFPRRKLRI